MIVSVKFLLAPIISSDVLSTPFIKIFDIELPEPGFIVKDSTEPCSTCAPDDTATPLFVTFTEPKLESKV